MHIIQFHYILIKFSLVYNNNNNKFTIIIHYLLFQIFLQLGKKKFGKNDGIEGVYFTISENTGSSEKSRSNTSA